MSLSHRLPPTCCASRHRHDASPCLASMRKLVQQHWRPTPQWPKAIEDNNAMTIAVAPSWKTDFYIAVVLTLLKSFLQNFQPQHQFCIKSSPHGERSFLQQTIGVGKGVNVSVAIFPSNGGVQYPVSDSMGPLERQGRSCRETALRRSNLSLSLIL